MRTFGVSLLVAVAHLTAICPAKTLVADRSSAVSSRSQFCANAPLTVAGTTFDRRNYGPYSRLEHRHNTKTILWCAAESETYIILEMIASTAGSAVQALLDSAYSAIKMRLDNIGDGPVSSGLFRIGGGNNMELCTRNAHNHQQTWGVLGAAISALRDYMSNNGYGEASFNVFDGGTEVAAGTIGTRSNAP
ncbi:MAG: hypothetical protein FRX48_07531 [Lasallia pustulata]|uniref:Uncharacterized protein n=1 Tax=Lasallia pustulata TaxID=136370 RepID=A0A5M8PGF1_9LECA|nr:MAG: hypothetical protein FRX48_07531 [Lasallia pustulata]